jgi:hypothetical protein
MKVFGVASEKRFEGAPDIPSLAEQGYPVGLEGPGSKLFLEDAQLLAQSRMRNAR